jgi:hypothetical protein
MAGSDDDVRLRPVIDMRHDLLTNTGDLPIRT